MENRRKKIVGHSKHEGVFVPAEAERKDCLFTLHLVQHDSVIFERSITVQEENRLIRYRLWNPVKSKLAAAIIKGIENLHIRRGSHVLYLGTGFGTTLFHVSDIVGPEGIVYAVENSVLRGRQMSCDAERRLNIQPIIQDARNPSRYRKQVFGLVDVIISDLAQSDQIDILSLNAKLYLKEKGHFLFFLQAYCTAENAENVVAGELKALREKKLKSIECVTLEPYDRRHIVIRGIYQQKSTKVEKEEQDCCENF